MEPLGVLVSLPIIAAAVSANISVAIIWILQSENSWATRLQENYSSDSTSTEVSRFTSIRSSLTLLHIMSEDEANV